MAGKERHIVIHEIWGANGRGTSMHIVIIGAGNVGYAIARVLSSQHSVMIVEKDERRYEYVINTLNVGVLNANGASPSVLESLLQERVDLFLAVTESDETNIFACLIAKRIRPDVVTIARMREHDYTDGERVSNFLDVDQVLCPEYLMAEKMRKIATLENVIDLDRLPIYNLELAKFRINHDRSGIASVPFRDLPLPPNSRVLCIHRGGEVIVPQAHDVLSAGDEIVVIAKDRGIRDFDEFLGSTNPPRDILIIGGGIVAQYLIKMLESEAVSVRLIEKDEARCKELAQRFNRTIIINDNGSDPLVLRNENVGQTDVLVCATKSEEGNLLACLVGKHLGVPKTITTYAKQEYKDIFQMAGIDSAISYHEVVANEIVKRTVPDHPVMLMTEGFKAELVSMVIGPRCRVKGKRICQLEMPERSTIAMVISDSKPGLPHPDTYIMEGDTLLIYADLKDISALERLLNADIPVDP